MGHVLGVMVSLLVFVF